MLLGVWKGSLLAQVVLRTGSVILCEIEVQDLLSIYTDWYAFKK